MLARLGRSYIRRRGPICSAALPGQPMSYLSDFLGVGGRGERDGEALAGQDEDRIKPLYFDPFAGAPNEQEPNQYDLDQEDYEAEEEAGPRQREVDMFGRAYGTGRRKTAVARVWCSAGSGKFKVNKRDMPNYFGISTHRAECLAPLACTNKLLKMDVWCTVQGGGFSGQAGAVKHGLGRALDAYDPHLRSKLRAGGCMTRDPRMVERKKVGQPKAVGVPLPLHPCWRRFDLLGKSKVELGRDGTPCPLEVSAFLSLREAPKSSPSFLPSFFYFGATEVVYTPKQSYAVPATGGETEGLL
ncbi:unnamed protein product [Chrysoparadoxa australica]